MEVGMTVIGAATCFGMTVIGATTYETAPSGHGLQIVYIINDLFNPLRKSCKTVIKSNFVCLFCQVLKLRLVWNYNKCFYDSGNIVIPAGQPCSQRWFFKDSIFRIYPFPIQCSI